MSKEQKIESIIHYLSKIQSERIINLIYGFTKSGYHEDKFMKPKGGVVNE